MLGSGSADVFRAPRRAVCQGSRRTLLPFGEKLPQIQQAHPPNFKKTQYRARFREEENRGADATSRRAEPATGRAQPPAAGDPRQHLTACPALQDELECAGRGQSPGTTRETIHEEAGEEAGVGEGDTEEPGADRAEEGGRSGQCSMHQHQLLQRSCRLRVYRLRWDTDRRVETLLTPQAGGAASARFTCPPAEWPPEAPSVRR